MYHCPKCGGILKFKRYQFENQGLIFGKAHKVYSCKNCGFEGMI